ncbi:hypothetical protein ACU4GI_38955 [Cupriavidus basilensis]
MMTTQLHEGLIAREFKDAVLSIAAFKAWLKARHLEIGLQPELADQGFIQVESLLCAIERAARQEYTREQARAIVATRPAYARQALAALPSDHAAELESVLEPTWLVGAEAHRAWREQLHQAIARGELLALCPVTKLPMVSKARPSKDDNPLEVGDRHPAPMIGIGTNSKACTDAYIRRRAQEVYAARAAMTMQGIAEVIAREMKANGYRGERGEYLDPATVVKAIPAGLTGGRRKNGNRNHT